ncbi:MAG: hypothetical protein R3C05_19360 [Pirellulaceae bacterium]
MSFSVPSPLGWARQTNGALPQKRLRDTGTNQVRPTCFGNLAGIGQLSQSMRDRLSSAALTLKDPTVDFVDRTSSSDS